MQVIRKLRKKRRSLEDWKGLLKEYRLSGLRVGEFCALQKISRSNFYQFQARLRKEEAQTLKAFIPITIREEDKGVYGRGGSLSNLRIEAGLKVRSIKGVNIEFEGGCGTKDLKLVLDAVK